MHSCDQCGRSFTRPENLNRHRKAHARIPPHKCKLCPKVFSRSDLLRKHEGLHLRKQREDATTIPSTPHRDTINQSVGLPNDQSRPLNVRGSSDTAVAADGLSIPQGLGLQWQSNSVANTAGEFNAIHESGRNQESASVQDGTDRYLGEQVYPVDREDMSSLSHPLQEQGSGVDNWFTSDFYQELHEVSTPEAYYQVSDHGLNTLHYLDTFNGMLFDVSRFPDASSIDELAKDSAQRGRAAASGQDLPEPISRIPSPPNVPSKEDGWLFAWNPSSAAIRQTHPIIVDPEDPLLLNNDPKYNMGEEAWEQLKHFLGLPSEGEAAHSYRGSLTLPPLPVANAFVGLFFTQFYAQAPILHQPTLNIQSLPPPLHAAMIVIGAKYSHLRHTRRFAIVLLDLARQRLQIAIENDRRLTRKPEILYSLTLLCFAGLWCGNKQAFEIAESLHGTLVTLLRHLPPTSAADSGRSCLESAETKESLTATWTMWIKRESLKRLKWFVFMVDGQFSSLLNIRSLLCASEVALWECPCDEEFWTAPTARVWRSLLGSATVPPSPRFAMVMSPFAPHMSHKTTDPPAMCMRLNQWTAFLLLMAIGQRVFDWSTEWILLMAIKRETLDDSDFRKLDMGTGVDDLAELACDKERIFAAIFVWAQHYLVEGNGGLRVGTTDFYFCHASKMLYTLTRVMLMVPLTTLQDALGKSGQEGVEQALHALESWTMSTYSISDMSPNPLKSGYQAVLAAREAIQTICTISETEALQSIFPYNIVTHFLLHVLIWAFVRTAPADIQQQLRQALFDVPESRKPTPNQLREVLYTALLMSENGSHCIVNSIGVLKYAAQVLSKMGTWGAALNMALLLHRRSEISTSTQ